MQLRFLPPRSGNQIMGNLAEAVLGAPLLMPPTIPEHSGRREVGSRLVVRVWTSSRRGCAEERGDTLSLYGCRRMPMARRPNLGC